MEFIDFLGEMLGITKDFAVTKIEKNELEKTINIHIEYLPKTYSKNGKEYAIYDRTPVRKWQHLNWFEYKCYLIGSLPRYIAEDGKPKVIVINFAPPQKGYTHLFAREIIYALKKVRVQSTVADLFNTTDYIVRSIMESAVGNGLEERGLVKDFKNISLDEKAYTKGHHYATILIDVDTNTVLDMVEGRKEEEYWDFNIEKNLTPISGSTQHSYMADKTIVQLKNAFPNPSCEVVNIEFVINDPLADNLSSKLVVYDMHGKIMYQEKYKGNGVFLNTINTETWNQGVYIYELSLENQAKTLNSSSKRNFFGVK